MCLDNIPLFEQKNKVFVYIKLVKNSYMHSWLWGQLEEPTTHSHKKNLGIGLYFKRSVGSTLRTSAIEQITLSEGLPIPRSI